MKGSAGLGRASKGGAGPIWPSNVSSRIDERGGEPGAKAPPDHRGDPASEEAEEVKQDRARDHAQYPLVEGISVSRIVSVAGMSALQSLRGQL